MKRLVVLVVLVVLALVSLSACEGSFSIGGDGDSHRLEVRGSHTGFDAEVPAGWGIVEVRDADTCGSVSYRIEDADGETRVVVEAVPTSCAEAAENGQIGNGQHGIFRTLADVPDPNGVKKISSDLGDAEVFTQEYFECTNSCRYWDEPVAIVTLAEPVDAGYPTLVLRADKAEVERGQLEEIVRSLAPPYVPTSG
jgi:hypothetical protein